MITPIQVRLVQESWAAVAPISTEAADLFYDRLFELDPELRPMFPEGMTEQKKKLMQTLAVCVNGLNELGTIVPAVRDLGRRHVDYGVLHDHYGTVRDALLWTLEQGLGPMFTPDVATAWKTVYNVLASTMKEAAAEAVKN